LTSPKRLANQSWSSELGEVGNVGSLVGVEFYTPVKFEHHRGLAKLLSKGGQLLGLFSIDKDDVL